MTAKMYFRSEEVMRLTNLTQRQLDYWDKTGFIKPSKMLYEGTRPRRLYDFKTLIAFRTALRLLNAGLSMQKVRKAVAKLKLEMDGYSVQDILSSFVFLTDGQNVFRFFRDPPRLEHVMSGQVTLVFAVNVGKLAADLERDMSVLELQPKSTRRKKSYEIPEFEANLK